MSVVIVGGNECMEGRYKDICKSFDCKAKVFVKYATELDKKIGTPDLAVVFSNTVSHKVLNSVNARAKKLNFPVEICRSSGACALKSVLDKFLSERTAKAN